MKKQHFRLVVGVESDRVELQVKLEKSDQYFVVDKPKNGAGDHWVTGPFPNFEDAQEERLRVEYYLTDIELRHREVVVELWEDVLYEGN